MSRHLFIVFFVIAALLRSGSALNCYQCKSSSNNSSYCENNMSMATKQNCKTGFVCAHYSIEESSLTTTIRGCSDPNVCNNLVNGNSHTMGYNQTIKFCHTCNFTDYCNSALPIQANTTFFIVPVFVYIISKFV